ncbi:MAG: SDR family NAD(P)-dependent oxidoreductase, partial [Pseudomonadales bacterium]|nr:SDR family NAD(P)-dependent oxidoreductase [Pseudomonadales bacterium]
EKNYGRIVCTSSGSGIWGNFGQSNYGAAKMAMLGFMNVLALEGAGRDIRVNCLAPGAATRMIGSIPGRDVDPDNPDPERHPRLVSPAVLFMCSENAPNGVTLNAAGGNFSRAEVFVNKGVRLGVDATYEDLAPLAEQLLDMKEAAPRQRRQG